MFSLFKQSDRTCTKCGTITKKGSRATCKSCAGDQFEERPRTRSGSYTPRKKADSSFNLDFSDVSGNANFSDVFVASKSFPVGPSQERGKETSGWFGGIRKMSERPEEAAAVSASQEGIDSIPTKMKIREMVENKGLKVENKGHVKRMSRIPMVGGGNNVLCVAVCQNAEAILQTEALSIVNSHEGFYDTIAHGHTIGNADILQMAPAYEALLSLISECWQDSQILASTHTTLRNMQHEHEIVSPTMVKYIFLDIVGIHLLYGYTHADLHKAVHAAQSTGLTGLDCLLTLIKSLMEHINNLNASLDSAKRPSMVTGSTNQNQLATLWDSENHAGIIVLFLVRYLQGKINLMEAALGDAHPDWPKPLPVVLNRDTFSTEIESYLEKPNKTWHSMLQRCIDTALALFRHEHGRLAKGLDELRVLEDMEVKWLTAEPTCLVLCTKAIKAYRKQAPEHTDIAQVRENLADLRRRIAKGEKSAVGGAAYPRKRLPLAILDELAKKDGMKVVVYDGSYNGAMDFARLVMDEVVDDSFLDRCELLEVVGLDGGGMRNVLTFHCGRQCLVLCASGASRMCHVAAGICLHTHSDTNEPIPDGSIILGSSGTDWPQIFRKYVEQCAKLDLEQWEEDPQREVCGINAANLKQNGGIVNALLIVQNPKDLALVFGGNMTGDAVKKNAARCHTDWLFMTHIRVGDRLVRTFVPKVGGSGLYGLVCGHFLTGFFQATVDGVKSPHVFFNGTAGGFAGSAENKNFVEKKINGLGKVKPGGIFMPTKSITAWGAVKDILPMRTCLPKDPEGQALGTAILSEMARAMPEEKVAKIKACISFTDNHAAVMAPALETYEYINEIVDAGIASIDVEGAATNQALHAIRDSGVCPEATFTPIYTHSDDPRASSHDFYESLASMGPFFEGSSPLPELLDVVKFLFDRSIRDLKN